MTHVLQASLPFMVTPGSYPGPEHTWTGRGRSQTRSHHLRPLLPPPPPITSAPVTQSFVLINRSWPPVPDRRLGATGGASCSPGTDQVWLHQKEPPPQLAVPSTRASSGERRERRVRRSKPFSELGARVKLHQEVSGINPLNATWRGGGPSLRQIHSGRAGHLEP